MFKDIIFSLWFLLPAAVANMTPIAVAKLPVVKNWNAPIDGGKMFRGKPILGPHKTWRGVVFGVLLATLTLWLQQVIIAHGVWPASITDDYMSYVSLPLLIAGPLFGIGALGGDAIESFFKRRRNIESGKSWIPFDQIDFIVGTIIATLLVVQLPLRTYAWMLGLFFVGHLAFSYIGWLLKLKDEPI
jgi:CDP-2,3-bis-(O-geranylgeranyl)-sn-glycerol synthase